MRWGDGRRSGNVEDRRGMSGPGRLVGGGLGTVLLVIVALYFGVDPSILLNQGGMPVPGPNSSPPYPSGCIGSSAGWRPATWGGATRLQPVTESLPSPTVAISVYNKVRPAIHGVVALFHELPTPTPQPMSILRRLRWSN